MPKRPVLCSDRVRHVGDNLAFIIAENLSVAKDAAELIEVKYDSLDAIADTAGALESSAPTIHPDAPNNLAFDWGHGEESSTNQAFDEAVHIVSLELINNKLIVNSMEPRGAIAEFDSATGKATLHACTQGGWLLKDQIANHTLKTEPEKVRVITPDVGGGFGVKLHLYADEIATVLASRMLASPVKYIATRGESFQSDAQAREFDVTAAVRFTKDSELARERAIKLFREINAKIDNKEMVFDKTVRELCDEYLKEQKKRIRTGSTAKGRGNIGITQGRFTTLRTQVEKHFLGFVGEKTKLSTIIPTYFKNDYTVLERRPLENTAKKKQLVAFRHEGFWQCMDTKRDRDRLNKILNNRKTKF